MKAIVYYSYGSPDVLRCEELEKPAPGDTDVLIKVRAASVNPLDWRFMRGKPRALRMASGLRKPKTVARPGHDVAGQVEAVGRSVTRFNPGDEVFGACSGAFADYACAAQSALVIKPENVTFEQAASVPVAALTALQGLRDKGQIQPGQKVLINGAAGGVGTFAVQIAKSFGAEVTGVCSTRNVDMVRSIGADHVIDYTQEDFTEGGERYDIFLDCFASRSLSACRRVLNPKGTYILVGGPVESTRDLLASFLKVLVLSRFVSQKLVAFAAKSSQEDLAILCDLMRDGKVVPVVDRCYGLSEAPEAVRYLEAGHARGKVVITV
jgi:NADPH:quinone reductase-like Zn-dependent oxidoreductase